MAASAREPVPAGLRGPAVGDSGKEVMSHRGRRLAEDLHFFLKVADPLPCCSERGVFVCCCTGLQATIDEIAVPPPVQARFSDPERRGDVTDPPP